MRRADRARDRAFALEVIDRCEYGVAAISTGADTPYCLPLSLVRIENELFFHCALEGRKLELLRRNPQVCVTFVSHAQPAYLPANNIYTTYYASAIVTGAAYEVTDPDRKIAALRALCEKLTPNDMAGFDLAIRRSLAATGVWGIHIDQISGKEKAEKA